MHDVRKRGPDNVIENSDKIIKIKNVDNELWHAHTTKGVDIEREKRGTKRMSKYSERRQR